MQEEETAIKNPFILVMKINMKIARVALSN